MSQSQFARRKNWVGGDMTASAVDEDIRNLRQQLMKSNNLGFAVNVKDFGALGDGVTDDTLSIQSAINTGNSIFIPATSNYYKLTVPIVLSSNNQYVYGSGNLSKVVQT